jgi:hypothetical protein
VLYFKKCAALIKAKIMEKFPVNSHGLCPTRIGFFPTRVGSSPMVYPHWLVPQLHCFILFHFVSFCFVGQNQKLK